MISGGQEFALIIIGMAMFAGIAKTSIRAKHGLPDNPGGPPEWKKRERARKRGYSLEDNSGEVETLRTENKRLTDQVETMQDRLIVLEKIVTDRGYTLASEIEALRDTKPSRKEVQ
jgi:predicted RNase H-like nuclease (RuvC/YqgF family)